jgi:hypothetical protein
MIAKIFGLPILGITTTSRKGYNKDLGKYFLRVEANHHMQGSSYLISQVATLEAWKILEALNEIVHFNKETNLFQRH